MGGSIRLPSRLLAMAALAALAGCQTGRPGRPYENEPLVGGSPAGRAVAGQARPPDPSARAAGDPPPPNSTTSPAALTQGAVNATGDRRTPAESVTLGGPRSKEARPV